MTITVVLESDQDGISTGSKLFNVYDGEVWLMEKCLDDTTFAKNTSASEIVNNAALKLLYGNIEAQMLSALEE